jgi:flagellar hook-basal body complex protein FliE
MSIPGVRDVGSSPVPVGGFGKLGGDDAIAPTRKDGDDGGFGVHFEHALGDLERTTAQADTTAEGLVTGEVDIHEAMVAMEKADLVLRVAGTVRNKVIDAYQQLMQAAGS